MELPDATAAAMGHMAKGLSPLTRLQLAAMRKCYPHTYWSYGPLGSLPLWQVHLARLRRFSRSELAGISSCMKRQRAEEYVLAPGEGAWDVCNSLGMSLQELRTANKGKELRGELLGA